MIIGEIGSNRTIPADYGYYAPFVGLFYPGAYTLASFWTTTFGFPGEDSVTIVNITAISVGLTEYQEALSVADCLNQEESWYFDFAEQKLYIHFEHLIIPEAQTYRIGEAIGFSDETVISIEGIEYEPLIVSIPDISEQEDLVNSGQMSFMTGKITHRNVGGAMDSVIEKGLYGQTYNLYYLPSNLAVPTRADLRRVKSLWVEDYDISTKRVNINIQDKRKSQNISIPTETFKLADYPDIKEDLAGDLIPLAYGPIREAPGIPTNELAASTTVRYRVAQVITALTTVWLKIDEVWTEYTPTNIDLPTGSFDIAGAKTANDAAPYDCKAEFVGIANTHASDIIKDLNLRYLSLQDTSSNYDNEEWAEEEAELEQVGVLFDESIKLYEAIESLQSGSNLRFRYEIKSDGRRTIRIDDPLRTQTFVIDNLDFDAQDEIEVQNDSSNLYTEIKVKYAKSWESGKFLSVTNDDYAENALLNYRQNPSLEVETWLTNSTQANARAALDAEKFKEPSRLVELNLFGVEFMFLRIYDTGKVALTPGFVNLDDDSVTGRLFYGLKDCQVISINPDLQALKNSVTLRLI